MSFEPKPDRQQTSIGAIGYQFYDPAPGSNEAWSARYSVQILDQDGKVMEVREADMPLTAISDMPALIASWRALAQALIPTSP